MRKLIEPALGVMVVLSVPVLGVLGFQVLAHQHHLVMGNHQGHSVLTEGVSASTSGGCCCAFCMQAKR